MSFQRWLYLRENESPRGDKLEALARRKAIRMVADSDASGRCANGGNGARKKKRGEKKAYCRVLDVP